jgi:hypothetical protein
MDRDREFIAIFTKDRIKEIIKKIGTLVQQPRSNEDFYQREFNINLFKLGALRSHLIEWVLI